MKAVRMILVVLFVVVVILAVGLFVWILTFDINQYKSLIARELSSRIGREVRVGGISLGFSIRQGVSLNVKEVSVSDDPVFSSEDMLAADQISLNVDVQAYLFKKQILISAVEIDHPRIHLVMNTDGRINLQELVNGSPQEKTMAGKGSKNAVFTPSVPTPAVNLAQPRPSQGSSAPLPPMLIRSVRIINGSFDLINRASDPALIISFRKIGFQSMDLSLDKPFGFRLDCSLWADPTNIHVLGKAKVDQNNAQIRLMDVNLQTDLSEFVIRDSPFYAVLREQLKIEDAIQGKLSVDVSQAVFSQSGLLSVSVDGQLSNGKIVLGVLSDPLSDIHLGFHMTESDLEIKAMSLSYALGKISLRGKLSDYLKERRFLFDGDAEDLHLSELIAHEKMPVLEEGLGPIELTGRIHANFSAEGHGSDIPSLRNSVVADGTMALREGSVKNVNILRLVLDKISFIPDLNRRIEENLSPEDLNKLKKNETILRDIEAGIKIQQGGVSVDHVELNADGFVIAAKGWLGFDQNLVLDVDFYIAQDLSSHLVAAVDELSYLLDEEQQISIPFRPYRGKLNDVRIYPDIESLSKKIIRNKGQEELRKVIFRALDLGDGNPPPLPDQPAQDQTGIPSQKEDPKPGPEEMIIDGILNAIFKGGEAF